jgi:dTDP-4-amino-4,6-dideoxygalactose transaminase
MAEWGAAADLPVTDELARTHVAIPMSPVLTAEQAAEVAGVVRSARLQHQ